MAQDPSVYDLLSQLPGAPQTDNSLIAFLDAYDSIRKVTPGNEYSNNNADASVFKEMITPTVQNIRFRAKKGWLWHSYPASTSPQSRNVKERISLNVYPSPDLIKELDDILLQDHDKHIYNYKTPSTLPNWSERHDPITIYCYDLDTELLTKINDVASKYTRESKEIEKVADQNPYGVELADGVYYNTEVTPAEGIELYNRLGKICSKMKKSAEVFSDPHSDNLPNGYMSKGQYFVLKKWTEIIEQAVTDKTIKGEAIAYYMLGDPNYDSAKYEPNTTDYHKNLQELANRLKKEGHDKEYLEFLKRFGYSTDIEKYLNPSQDKEKEASDPKKNDEKNSSLDPTAEFKEEIVSSPSSENIPHAEVSEKANSTHPMNFLIQEFETKRAVSKELENRVKITPDSNSTEEATFNGQNYPIGDKSSLAYTWENSGLKGTDTISAKENNGKGGCDFTISHPQKDVVSNESIRATIDATVKYMNNQYKDNDDYKGFTFSINPKTPAFQYKVAEELFKYTPAYAKENAETASFYAKQLESIKNFKISGVEIDKTELSQYKSAAELNDLLAKKIEDAQKAAEQAKQAALKQALEQSRS